MHKTVLITPEEIAVYLIEDGYQLLYDDYDGMQFISAVYKDGVRIDDVSSIVEDYTDRIAKIEAGIFNGLVIPSNLRGYIQGGEYEVYPKH